jgi:hypothetical protein
MISSWFACALLLNCHGFLWSQRGFPVLCCCIAKDFYDLTDACLYHDHYVVKIHELEQCVYFFTLVIHICHNLQDYVTIIHQCWFCIYFESMEKMKGSLSLVEGKKRPMRWLQCLLIFTYVCHKSCKRDSFISFVFIGC